MNDQTPETTGPGEASVWTQPRFVIAAVVVAMIVVMGVVLAITGLGSDADSAPSSKPAPTAAPSTPADADSDSVCGLPAGDQTVPVTPPPAEWELVNTVAVPTAPEEIGPGRVSEVGLRSCFAQSPLGALYAAVNFFAATGDPVTRRAAFESLVLAGESRDAALQEIDQELARPGPDQRQPSVQLAGFTFLNYDHETGTVVDLAFRGHNGEHVRVPITLRWEEGDWKVVLPPNGGELGDLIQPIPDLTGYVPWGGV